MISYRAEFWIQGAGGAAVSIIVAYALWKAVFLTTNATTIGGYSFEGMILYYCLVPFVNRCVQVNEMGNISIDVYDGSFTRYLILPVSALGYKYLSNLAVTIIGLVQLALGFGICLLLFKTPPEIHITFWGIGAGVVSMFMGGILFFFMAACLEMIAFWMDNVWSLLVMLKMSMAILGGSLVPLSLFPDSMRAWLEYMPFTYLASFPVKTFLGQTSPQQWIQGLFIMMGWTMVFFVLCRLALGRGLLRYSGVGQ